MGSGYIYRILLVFQGKKKKVKQQKWFWSSALCGILHAPSKEKRKGGQLSDWHHLLLTDLSITVRNPADWLTHHPQLHRVLFSLTTWLSSRLSLAIWQPTLKFRNTKVSPCRCGFPSSEIFERFQFFVRYRRGLVPLTLWISLKVGDVSITR